jgi:hypothetical protein
VVVADDHDRRRRYLLLLRHAAALRGVPLHRRPDRAQDSDHRADSRESTIARWTRTLSTMFAAGVPLVESLDAVAGAAGNSVFAAGTKRIQTEVSTGASLTTR